MESCLIFGAMPTNKAVVTKYIDYNKIYFIITADSGWRQAKALGLPVHLAVGDFDSAPVPGPEEAHEVLCLPAEKDETDLFFAVRQALARGYKDICIFGALGGRPDQTQASLATLLYLTQQGARGRLVDQRCEVWCIGPGYLPAGQIGGLEDCQRQPAGPGYLPAGQIGGPEDRQRQPAGPGFSPIGEKAEFYSATGQSETGAGVFSDSQKSGPQACCLQSEAAAAPPRACGATTLLVPAVPGRYLSVFAAAGEARGVTERGVKYPLDRVVLSPAVPLGVSNEFAEEVAIISCEYGYLFVMTVEKDG